MKLAVFSKKSKAKRGQLDVVRLFKNFDCLQNSENKCTLIEKSVILPSIMSNSSRMLFWVMNWIRREHLIALLLN